MLDSEDIRVLSFLRSQPDGACAWQLLRETFGQDIAFLERLNALAGEGLVKPDKFDFVGFDGEPTFRMTATEYRLSVEGRRALEEAVDQRRREIEQKAAEEAKEKTRRAERAQDIRRQIALAVIGWIVGFISGYLIRMVFG